MSISSFLRRAAQAGLALLLLTAVRAQGPAWWQNQGVLVTGSAASDYSPANQGQLKFLAKAARTEMGSNASAAIVTMVNGWSNSSQAKDYAVATLGQLKAVSQPFYDQLGLAYPWTATTADDSDYAIATLGQLKMAFNFDLSNFTMPDGNNNGIADWWEQQFFGDISIASGAVVPNSGGLTYQELYNWYLQQSQSSTVGDGIPDSWKQSHGIDINDSDAANKDPDGDGLTNADEYDAQLDPQNPDWDDDGILDGQDLYPKIKNLSRPANLKVVVPDWETQSHSGSSDYSNVDYTKIEVHWDASENSPAGYTVERRVNSDIWQTVATISQLKYTDQDLLANLHYQYRITAYKDVDGQLVLSDPAYINYEVPLILSFDVKSSYINKGKYGFSEYTNPSTPPKWYLVQNASSTFTNSTSNSNGGSTSRGSYSYSWTFDPAAHSETQHGEYSFSAQSDYSYPNGAGSHYEESASSTFDGFDQSRGKANLTATTSRSFSSKDSSSSSSWTRTSSTSTWGSENDSGSYLYEGTYSANNGSPIWMGDDFDLKNGVVTYSGNSSNKWNLSSSGGSYNFNGYSTVNSDGSWSGNGGWEWSYAGTFDIPVSETQTERSYASSYLGHSSSGTYSLSQEYTTEALISDAIHDMPDYPKDWVKNWYGWGNYGWGYWNYNYWGYWGGWYNWGYPWYGWWIAGRSLSKTEGIFSVGKMKYRFRASPSTPYTMKWYEVFVPENDPDTEIDESKNIQIIRERSWTLGSGSNTSDEYEVTDGITRTQNGYYTILIQPVHIGVEGIGEAGKDKTGDDTNPGKVVLINDNDADSDGIPDYADGYSLNPQIEQETTCDNASFTPIDIGLYATDPEHAKIRFTYAASDPKQVTATSTDPFTLPASGMMRLWKKDASEQRNGSPVKNGGDYIQPGVDYTFADLGIDGSESWLTCYVELVKLSNSVADIPIKVEVDPTGSMGYVWSDQLRFTASKVEVESKGMDSLPFESIPVFEPSSLRNYYEHKALFGAPPKPYQISRVKITDPRKNLTQARIQNTDLTMSQQGLVSYSQEFIGIRPNSGSEKALTQVQAPLIPKQDAAPVEVAGITYNKPQLPWPIKDVKKVDDDTDDVVIEGIPPKTSEEDDNAYIQRPLNDQQVAFIEPHAASDDKSPEMPHLVAKWPGNPSHDLKVKWRLEVEYQRGNGLRAKIPSKDIVRFPHVAYNASPIFTEEMAADEEWRIFEKPDWINEIAQNGFFGGMAKLYVWFPVKGKEPTEPFMTFRIGGKNPTQEKAREFIDKKAVPQINPALLSFAYAIGMQESSDKDYAKGYKHSYYTQFYTKYRSKKHRNGQPWRGWAIGYPTFGDDHNDDGSQNGNGGYGIYQITQDIIIPRQDLWNWQENCKDAIKEISQWRGEAEEWYRAAKKTWGNPPENFIPPNPPGEPALPNNKNLTAVDWENIVLYNGPKGLGKGRNRQLIGDNGKKKTFRASVWTYDDSQWNFHDNVNHYIYFVTQHVDPDSSE